VVLEVGEGESGVWEGKLILEVERRVLIGWWVMRDEIYYAFGEMGIVEV
jgi:hypothetical protein